MQYLGNDIEANMEIQISRDNQELATNPFIPQQRERKKKKKEKAIPYIFIALS